MDALMRKLRSNKLKSTNLKKALEVVLTSDRELLKWSSNEETKHNFGDALNPWLYKKITGKTPENANSVLNLMNKPVYSAIGSILDNNKTRNLIVWGSGFKKEDAVCVEAPKEILAVRGPFSRNNILKLGLECPEVYGDPALLIPRFYKPEVAKTYRLGIIPHYVDKSHAAFLKLQEKLPCDVLVIDIERDLESVVSCILSCETIASSSLHGIIVADAYGIPSRYIRFSDNVAGGDFKFRDYMASVKRPFEEPLRIQDETSVDSLLSGFDRSYAIDIDLDKLLSVCPFDRR